MFDFQLKGEYTYLTAVLILITGFSFRKKGYDLCKIKDLIT